MDRVEQHLPIRCRAEEVADQLRLVQAGLPFLAERPWQEVGRGRMRIELLNLWLIELLLGPGDDQQLQMTLVDRAAAPDGRCWLYGCQRDDWSLGPDSRIVEPLQFLNNQERQALQKKLQQAVCWPEPLTPAAPPLQFCEQIKDHQTPRRSRRRAQGRSRQQASTTVNKFASGFNG